MVVEIPKGWGGGYYSGQKMEVPGRRGVYMKFPLWWGYGYFLELHIGKYQHGMPKVARKAFTPAFSVTCIGDIFVHLSTCHLSTCYLNGCFDC